MSKRPSSPPSSPPAEKRPAGEEGASDPVPKPREVGGSRSTDAVAKRAAGDTKCNAPVLKPTGGGGGQSTGTLSRTIAMPSSVEKHSTSTSGTGEAVVDLKGDGGYQALPTDDLCGRSKGTADIPKEKMLQESSSARKTAADLGESGDNITDDLILAVVQRPRSSIRAISSLSKHVSCGTTRRQDGEMSGAGAIPSPTVVPKSVSVSQIPESTPERSLKHYNTYVVVVEVKDLTVPNLAVRPFLPTDGAVQSFKNLFSRGMYGEGGRVISVVVDPKSTTSREDILSFLSSTAAGKEHVCLSDLPGVRLLVADGVHRLAALRELLEDTKREGSESPFALIPVELYMRKDEAPATLGDIHTIGFRQNDMDCEGRTTTIYDRLHALVSTLVSTTKMSEGEVEACLFEKQELEAVQALRACPDALNLRKLVGCRGIHVVPSIRAQQRYCQIAVGLAKFHDHAEVAGMVQKAMKKGDEPLNCSLGLAFLERSELWESSSLLHFKYLFLSICKLRKRLRLGEEFADIVALRLEDFWGAINAAISQRGIDPEQGLKSIIHVQGHPESVYERMKTWMGQLVKRQITSDVSWVKKRDFYRNLIVDTTSWPPSPLAEQSTPSAPAAGHESATSTALAPASEARTPPAPVNDARGGDRQSSDSVPGNPESEVTPLQPEDHNPLPDGRKSSKVRPSLRAATSPNVTLPTNSQVLVQATPDDDEDVAVKHMQSPDLTASGVSCAKLSSSSGQKTGKDTNIVGDNSIGLPLQNSPDSKNISSPDKKRDDKGKKSGSAEAREKEDGCRSSDSEISESTSEEGDVMTEAVGPTSRKIAGTAMSKRNSTERDEGKKFFGQKKERKLKVVPKATRKETTSSAGRDSGRLIPLRQRVTDSEGFAVLRRFPGGFEYKAPRLRDGGFTQTKFEKDDDDVEGGALVGLLKDGSWIRIYPDSFARKVRVSGFWKLKTLPSQEHPIWREKYQIPLSLESILRYNVPGIREAILRSMGIRPPHQAHFRLSLEDIAQLRFSVFEYLSQNVAMPNDETEWQDYMDVILKAKRELLDSQGYIVFDGFVRREIEDEDSDDEILKNTYKWEEMFRSVENMFSFFHTDVPDSRSYLRDDKQKCWSRIRNGSDLPKGVPVRNSRWTSTPYCTNDRLEEDMEDILKARSYVEVATWILVHWLHLEAEHFDDIRSGYCADPRTSAMVPPLCATDSGSRALITSTDCEEQVAHLDYLFPEFLQTGKYPEVIRHVPYFNMSTGSEGCKLWILEGSHRFIFLDEVAKKLMAKAIGLTSVTIPPWSTIIVRGDVIHAGVSGESAGKRKCVRLHDYILRKGVPFADTINDQALWKLFKDLNLSGHTGASSDSEAEQRD